MLVTHGTFSSEAVSSGHPDKIADQISDAILDACLAQDPAARVAVECAIKGDLICLMGEITAKARIDAPDIARGVLRDVGHAGGPWGFGDPILERPKPLRISNFHAAELGRVFVERRLAACR
jgi:S-adenosylmethionine synthetase